jgi:hypothetical protein
MADIVGLLASILQLVDTVAKARDYIHDFRDAPKEQERLLDEIDTLEPLIRKLDNLMIGGSPAAGTEMVRNFEEPLNQLKITMEQLAQKLDLDGIRKLSGRVTWSMWGKDDVQQALNAVERYKSLLNTWLGLDIWFVKESLAVLCADLLQECDPRQGPAEVQEMLVLTLGRTRYFIFHRRCGGRAKSRPWL